MSEKAHHQDASQDDKAGPAVDWFYCSKCDKTLSLAEQTEHNDWHLAQDLESQDRNQSAVTQNQNRGPAASTGASAAFIFRPQDGMAYGNSGYRNRVSNAADQRAKDEQHMQNLLQSVQLQYRIYNPEIEPEHGEDNYNSWCNCAIHNYKRAKRDRYGIQRMWSNAVIYPGERIYFGAGANNQPLFGGNPYVMSNICSPYGYGNGWVAPTRPRPDFHEAFIHQTTHMNNTLNTEAQRKINAREPKTNIWADNSIAEPMAKLSIREKPDSKNLPAPVNNVSEKSGSHSTKTEKSAKTSKFSGFKKSLGIKSSEEKDVEFGSSLKQDILDEERGRWPDKQWREIVTVYQDKLGIQQKVALIREWFPIQYLHLLRAGYFEPIPVAWANLASNPLKFAIDAADGWPGITPAWRGYEDTAEERLYWVLNNRDNAVGARLKPDFMSVMEMALARMASAVEPPPQYFSPNDTCHVQHTSEGYSKQVMPPPFVPHDRPEVVSDDTMILLDVSGSMDFEPMRPIYERYMIMNFFRTMQPKNKDVARAIVRRFTDAMINHDHLGTGYDLVTFSSHAQHIGTINHQNFNSMWSRIGFGGGTRVMTGWQLVKDLHFRKHSESAIHHPVYGWQAGPKTPMLRLLLLLDGEATDMDEFELDLLGLSWAHVTIFLIGVDGCPHHHRHANELQRISNVNPHVAFVDAQGNMPERFVTHELLKRHLGYDITMTEFESMEQPPPYSE